MPKIRTTRTKKPPEGFEDIESVSMPSTFSNPIQHRSSPLRVEDTVKRAGMR